MGSRHLARMLMQALIMRNLLENCCVFTSAAGEDVMSFVLSDDQWGQMC